MPRIPKRIPLYYIVLALIFLFDLFFLFSPIWYDESWRVMEVIDKQYLLRNNLNFFGFPYGLQYMSKFLVFLFGTHELTFRLPTLLISLIASVLLIKVFQNRIHPLLLSLFIFLLNTNFIYFSHIIQYKQLATDAALYLAGVLFLLKYRNKNSVFLSSILLLLNTFSMNVVFLLPVFLLLLVRKKESLRSKFIDLIICLISVGITYIAFKDSSAVGTYTLDVGWANDFIKINSLPNIVLAISKNISLLDMFFWYQIPHLNNSALPLLKNLAIAFMSLFIAAGLYGKRKDKLMLLLIILPLLEVNILSLLNKWPIGNNRVNIFLVPLLVYLMIDGYLYLMRGVRLRVNKIVVISALAVIHFSFFLNSATTILAYSKHLAKPVIRKTFNFTEPIETGRVTEGMKCAVQEIVKVNKPNDTILLYHFLSEPEFGYYYWHYDFGRQYKTRIYPNNIFNNVEYAEISGRGYLPDRSEDFFKERFSKGNVYIIMIVGTEEKFANSQIDRATKYGKFVKFVPCRGLVASWHFAPK